MLDDKIEVKKGIVKDIVNIEFNKNELTFINMDPQIIIFFDDPVKGINIKMMLNEIQSFNSHVVVYFAMKNEDFSESRCLSFDRKYCYLETETDVMFDGHFDKIRIDLDDKNSHIDLNKLVISPLYEIPNFSRKSIINFPKLNNNEKILILTHDLSNSGAPILAFNIAKNLKEKDFNVVVASCYSKNNQLEEQYRRNDILLYKLDDFSDLKYMATGNLKRSLFSTVLDNQIQTFLESLRFAGYSKSIINSVASGKFAKILKDYDFMVLSLIHEMKNTIEYHFYQEGKLISQYADFIVFPDEVVRTDFESIYGNVYGITNISPQGVYLNNLVEDQSIENIDIKRVINNSSNKKIILGSGAAELRKGIDLFVSAAISLANLDENFVFVWTGNFYDSYLESWLQLQIEKSGFSNRIHIIPFVTNKNDYKKLLSKVSAFWLTSREDPFPSVALEAMNFGIPVFGFKNSGGFNTMAENQKAIIIDRFNIAQLSKKTFDYFNMSKMEECVNQDKVKVFLKSLNFEKYVDKLIGIINKDKIIEPDLNVFLYQNSDRKHYYDLQLPQKSLAQNMNFLRKARFKKVKLDKSEIVLLDTKIGSDNIGDDIIMFYCEKICNEVFKGKKLIHVPTHIYDEQSERMQDKLKILCGTNILYKEMETSRQLSFPKDILNMKNVCLLGVGMQELGLEKNPSDYTIKLLRFMLKNEFIHSVRDRQTKDFLESIGVKNVVYTGCPTLWSLSPEHCKQINRKKCKNVLTTVTDYKMDKNNDAFMLNTLKNEYDKVYIWIQGQLDYEYLQKIVNTKEFILVPPTLKALDEVLEKEDLDYIGTRLHAGIRSLNKFHRSLIISIDNRAREMAKYTNIPVMERVDMKNNLVEWIYSNQETNIQLPINEINLWKNQFNRK